MDESTSIKTHKSLRSFEASTADVRNKTYFPTPRTNVIRSVRKTAKIDHLIRHLCPYAWDNSAPTARIIVKFHIWVLFENLSRKFKIRLTRIMGTFHEDQNTPTIISPTVLLRMKNVSCKTCTENRNTQFLINNVFRNSCRLWGNVEKYCRAGQAAEGTKKRRTCFAC